MKIGIAGPIARESIAKFLHGDATILPVGYTGAPLLGTLIDALLSRGHSISAYTTSTDLSVSETVTATGDSFKITFCPQRRRAFRYCDGHWGRAADFFKLERTALCRAMQADAPDLVHAHWSYEFALAALESGLPNLITCHDAPQVVLKYSPNLYRFSRYLMARKVLSKANFVTAVSPYLQQALQLYVRNPLNLVPNPLPLTAAAQITTSRSLDSEKPRIVMVLNGWGARKNPQPALKAFASLRRRLPKATLRIIGAGFEAGGKGHTWARINGLTDGITFIGPQPYASVLANLAESDLLLHPSLEETFGMTIAEAMSLGVPVIGGATSGAVPWVVGGGGILTDVTSPDAIEAALTSLLSDQSAYQCCVSAARTRSSENFSAVPVAVAYEFNYQDVLLGTNRQSKVSMRQPNDISTFN